MIIKELRKFYLENKWNHNKVRNYRYNHIRPHRSLFMKTPVEVYFDLQQRLKVTEPQDKQGW